MHEAYVGIDVAFAKRKRLPLVACVRRGDVLEPLPLRSAEVLPPAGQGNARLLDDKAAVSFAKATIEYIGAVEAEFGVRVTRIAIDAPSDARRQDQARRLSERELDKRQISCFTTPTSAEFGEKVRLGIAHLAGGGSEARLPAANQLWMLVGFALFAELRRHWECLEVYPQAIAAQLRASAVHKSQHAGLVSQLQAVARVTGWPKPPKPGAEISIGALKEIAFGSAHDRLDAYLCAWVASLDEGSRVPLGVPPHDAIWVPRV